MRFSQNSFLIPWRYVHTASAQIEYELSYGKNFVRGADDTEYNQLPLQVGFFASLNSIHSKIKLENSLPGEFAGHSRFIDRSVSSRVSRYPIDLKNWFIIRRSENHPGQITSRNLAGQCRRQQIFSVPATRSYLILKNSNI